MNKDLKCCFATVITKSEYEVTAGRLYQAFKYLKSEFPFEILVTNNLSENDLPFFKVNNIPYRVVDLLQFKYNKDNFFWQDTASKFNIFTLTDYDYVCFIDADMAIDNLIDSIIYKNIPFEGSLKIFNYAKYPDGSVFFIKPSLDIFNKIKTEYLNYDYFTDEQLIYSHFNEGLVDINKEDWENVIGTNCLLHFNSPFKVYNYDVGNVIQIFRYSDIETYTKKIRNLYKIQLKLKEAFISMLNL